jgi:hypothetical protein
MYVFMYIYIYIVELITWKERFVKTWLAPIWVALICAGLRWRSERPSTFKRNFERASSEMLVSSKEHLRKCSIEAKLRTNIFENAQRQQSFEENIIQNAQFKQSLHLGSVLDLQIH